MKSLLAPAIGLAIVAILLHSGVVTPSLSAATLAFYAALVAGFLIAWRFHSSRIFFALLVLFLAERAIAYFSLPAGSSIRNFSGGPVHTAISAIGLLLPINFVLLSLEKERGFAPSNVGAAALVLFVEAVVVTVICRPEALARQPLHHAALPVPLPFYALVSFATAGIWLLVRFLLFRKPVESGMMAALIACFLALRFGGAGRIPTAYFAVASVLLVVSMVETSYLLAYHDELTTLPSRRAFNEALLRVVHPYSIAIVDIDHFKRCNDTYGHDTGDHVLRLVASRLARVAGDGQAYRCGGEEFAIIFPGRRSNEVLEHLEDLRAEIEASSFRLRGGDRRQEPRGPDRRNPGPGGRGRTGRASIGRTIRQLSRTVNKEISVTASIGVASSSPSTSAEQVIQAADKALYRAKAAGRNRLETASSARRRTRTRAVTA